MRGEDLSCRTDFFQSPSQAVNCEFWRCCTKQAIVISEFGKLRDRFCEYGKDFSRIENWGRYRAFPNWRVSNWSIRATWTTLTNCRQHWPDTSLESPP